MNQPFLVLLGLLAIAGLPSGVADGQGAQVRVTEKQLRSAAVHKVDPEYPAVARQLRVTGDVELEVWVDNAGSVEKASVIRGNTLLSGPALQAIRRWKFTPFRVNGQPAPATGSMTFIFEM
jgi:protein TonB